jgi:hypothetical protein
MLQLLLIRCSSLTIIIGAAVSLLVQKRKATSEIETLLILLGVSLAAAGLYCALVALGHWEPVVNVLLIAGAFTRSSSSASRAKLSKAPHARQAQIRGLCRTADFRAS